MSDWFSQLLGEVKDVAPTLVGAAGTVLSGGNVAVGGVLASLARKLTGTGADGNIQDAAKAILEDSDKLNQFRLQARQLELDELKLRTADVQDARKTLTVSHGAIIVSIIVLVAYGVSCWFVMFHAVPVGSQNLAYLLLGNLGTGFGMVLTFWLGSSLGSKNKDAIMGQYIAAAKADQAARAKGGT